MGCNEVDMPLMITHKALQKPAFLYRGQEVWLSMPFHARRARAQLALRRLVFVFAYLRHAAETSSSQGQLSRKGSPDDSAPEKGASPAEEQQQQA